MTSPDKMDLVEDGKSQPVMYGAVEGYDAILIAHLAREQAKHKAIVVHVVVDDRRLDLMQEMIGFFAPDVEVVAFPAWDCLPYDRVSPTADIVARRVHALSRLLQWKRDPRFTPRILIATVNAVLQKIMPKSALENASLVFQKGARLDHASLQSFLQAHGYIRTDTVRETGELSLRGDIIDLFPPERDSPVRIDLFGDEIEKIRFFDPLSQRSEEEAGLLTLEPVAEFILNDQTIQTFRRQYREVFGTITRDDPLYEAVSEGRRYNGMDHWLPFFYEQPLETIFDYVSSDTLILDHDARSVAAERQNQIQDFYQARLTLKESLMKNNKKSKQGDVSLSGALYHPLPPDNLYIKGLERFSQATVLTPFASPHASGENTKRGRNFSDIRAQSDGDLIGAVQSHISDLEAGHKKVVIASYSEGTRDRLKIMLKNAGIDRIKNCHTFQDIQSLRKAEIGMAILPLEHGFVTDDLAVMTEQDILGDRLTRKSKSRKKADQFLTEISSLTAGDLVVHVDHGIGRFESLETIHAAGRTYDCLKIIYAKDDRLFVPVENIEVLSRYGADEGTTALDSLGSASWQARKARVKKDLMRIADHLMKIAAARILRKGEKLQIEAESYQRFVARFPYHETDDQLRAIEDVIGDLGKDHPMDRLVCGDVGFGKTEIALRAAYIAAMAGAQVAVVVPTTLLARQHFAGFQKRFEGFGLKIAQLSRMVSAKYIKAAKDGLADGSVHIVIGTHALFAKDVSFAHLGLVIVDEEQRFGVKQKERLKELKHDVHILTLTATPIPRTLQMSLTGVKEMSLITTPPVDRLAIRTFILPYDPLVIREVLMREHYRGGQSFFVVPRIKDIEEIQEALTALVPDLKIVAAHGQLSATDLEDRMTAFYDRQYDILLATNIIESGLDIPTANTMIVHRADLFGLAQLYQIRGRIGRSKVRGYAYLTYDPQKALTLQGQKRLEVMETLDSLGAGFQLASHDMDIRGAGNLVGEEQSGHIREIGVELYQQMLEEAVAAVRGGHNDYCVPNEEGWSPQINMGLSVLIPERYVPDLSVRMSLYRRLADMQSNDDIESMAAEMIDRFGDLPDEVQNLLDIVGIKQLCKRAGVSHVDAGPKGAVIGFHNNSHKNPQKVMQWLEGKKGSIKIRPQDQKLVAVRQWENPRDRLNGIRALMTELAGL